MLSGVPEKGECVTLSWKHNLGKGAKARKISDKKIKASLSKMALVCMKVLNLRFASVDIVRSNGKFLVMEVNPGIMMESYARQGEKESEKAVGIYRKALIKMFSGI
jgi:glutathione synthase/RimK-type ligase-like ATP-grasp enzyme